MDGKKGIKRIQVTRNEVGGLKNKEIDLCFTVKV